MKDDNKVKKQNETANNANEMPDIPAMQDKWGVSAEEIKAAIAKVGYNKSEIEEYLLNNKWQKNDVQPASFQKRDLNENESY